jgi:hypothetical protein
MSAKFNIINLALRRLGQDPIATVGEDTENYRKVDDIYDLNLKSLLRSHPWSFAKKEVALTSTWTTLTAYVVGNFVANGSTIYRCLTAHTSGTFATDLTALKWVAVSVPVLEDYDYIHRLPADYLRLCKTSVEPDYSHKIKGHQLYSNSATISIEYIYFCKDPSAWATNTAYVVGDYVLQSNTIYYCLIAHTSGTFATDLAASKWEEQNIYDSSFTDAFATSLAYDLCMPITKDAKLKEVLGNELQVKLRLAKRYNGL